MFLLLLVTLARTGAAGAADAWAGDEVVIDARTADLSFGRATVAAKAVRTSGKTECMLMLSSVKASQVLSPPMPIDCPTFDDSLIIAEPAPMFLNVAEASFQVHRAKTGTLGVESVPASALLAARFPKAFSQVKKTARFAALADKNLVLEQVPGSAAAPVLLVSGRGENDRVCWVVNAQGAINTELGDSVCAPPEMGQFAERSTDLTDALVLSTRAEGGDSCTTYLTASSTMVTSCEYYVKGPSPAMLEQRAQAGEMSRAECDAELKAATEPFEGAAAQRAQFQSLVEKSTTANELWRAGRHDEAHRLWLELFRSYVDSKRTVTLPGEAGVWQAALGHAGIKADLNGLVVDLWAEALNNLGYALFREGALTQARAAYHECQALLVATGHTRPVLDVNLREVEDALKRP